MSANWTQAKEKATEILKKYPVGTPPVNAFDIANNENIQIVYFKPTEKTRKIAGLFVKDKKTIYLNSDDPADRQNFTLAHELAHYFLEHKPNEYGISWRNPEGYENKPEKEQEADCFAAELLMPTKLIRKVQKELDLQDTDVAALSKIFGVSISAMKYRLRDIKNGRATV